MTNFFLAASHRCNNTLGTEQRGFVTIQNSVDNHRHESCEITYAQQTDSMGNSPPDIMEKQIPRALQAAFQVRERFNGDDEIDRIDLEKLMAIMRNASDKEGEVYDKSETKLIEEVQNQMKKAGDDIFRPLSW